MFKIKEMKLQGEDRSFVEAFAKGLVDLMSRLDGEHPGFKPMLAGVVRTRCGQGVLVADPNTKTETSDDAIAQLEQAKSLLRFGSVQIGERIYDKPLSAEQYAEEHERIRVVSKETVDCLKKDRKSKDPSDVVTEAAILLASSVRLLVSIGVSDDALAEYLAVGKETMRRAHLRALELKASGSA